MSSTLSVALLSRRAPVQAAIYDQPSTALHSFTTSEGSYRSILFRSTLKRLHTNMCGNLRVGVAEAAGSCPTPRRREPVGDAESCQCYPMLPPNSPIGGNQATTEKSLALTPRERRASVGISVGLPTEGHKRGGNFRSLRKNVASVWDASSEVSAPGAQVTASFEGTDDNSVPNGLSGGHKISWSRSSCLELTRQVPSLTSSAVHHPNDPPGTAGFRQVVPAPFVASRT